MSNDVLNLIAAGLALAVVVIVAILQDRATTRENEAADDTERL